MSDRFYYVSFGVDGSGLVSGLKSFEGPGKSVVHGLKAVADPMGVVAYLMVPGSFETVNVYEAAAAYLRSCGVDVPEGKRADEVSVRERGELPPSVRDVIPEARDSVRTLLVTVRGSTGHNECKAMFTKMLLHFKLRSGSGSVNVVMDGGPTKRVVEVRVLVATMAHEDTWIIEHGLDKCHEVPGVRSKLRKGKISFEASIVGDRRT